MANLTIRNLDDGIVEALKSLAKAHNRSMEAEVRQILTDHVRARPAHLPSHLRGLDLVAPTRRLTEATPDGP